jgi:lysophospholipase L1-like esterase
MHNCFLVPSVVLAAASLASVNAASAQPAAPAPQLAPSEPHWVGTWSAASMPRTNQPSQPAGPSRQSIDLPPAVLAVAPTQTLTTGAQSPLHFNNQTLRQIVHISLGGAKFRVVVANTFGTAPLNIGAAQLALRDKDATIVSGSNRVLTFAGQEKATVPPGELLTSDSVDLVAPSATDLVVDLYLPDNTATTNSPLTIHAASWQTNYVSPPGNHAGAATLPVETTTAYRRSDGLITSTWFFLARVEVLAPPSAGAIVTIGDSLTDGTASTIDTNNRWPDHFARRLTVAGIRMAVLNAGIGGNRLLQEGNGPSALARFDRDALAQPGATLVIVLEGINDIGQARQNPSPSAADLIAAHRQLIERAHARGLKIYGATLLPFEGASYWTAVGEAKRQALNQWIRTSKEYDAVLDFDAVVRDPENPSKLQPAFDTGDHLHLNPAGYEALAKAIDLGLFQRR